MSVLEYWNAATDGHYDWADKTLFPWVVIDVPSACILQPNHFNCRGAVAQAAYNATVSAGHDLSAFDGFVVFSVPGRNGSMNLDAGTLGNTVVFPAFETLSWLCHEVGHILGFAHGFGILRNGDPEYGDPYDVMSYNRFGTAPTFDPGKKMAQLPAVYDQLGPLPPWAQVRLWEPWASTKRAQVIAETSNGWAGTYVLNRRGAGTGIEVLVLRPPSVLGGLLPGLGLDALGTIYVEYRSALGWDQGLETSGNSASRRAVVVHERQLSPDQSRPATWYRGRVVVPVELDSDVNIETHALSVRVVETAPDTSWVRVQLEPSLKGVGITATYEDNVVVLDSEPREGHTGCESGTWLWETREWTSVNTYRASRRGFDEDTGGLEPPPELFWSVGGQRVPGGNQGTLSLTLAGRTVLIPWTLDAQGTTLTLTSRPADGAYEVAVVATVDERSATTNQIIRTTASKPALFAARGIEEGFEGAFARAAAECIVSQINVWWPLLKLTVPEPPEWWKWLTELDQVLPTLARRLEVEQPGEVAAANALRDVIDRARPLPRG